MSESERHEDHDITIHIDRQVFHVEPGTMTGAQLRSLPVPPIGNDRELYEIVPGSDDVVVDDNAVVHLRQGMRFVSAPRNVTPG